MIGKRKGAKMKEHWSEVGRRLAALSAEVNKTERMDLIRQEAQNLELSPHSIVRFIVLSGLLQDLDVAPEQNKHFAIGVTEVLARIADRDKKFAVELASRIIKERVLYRETLQILRDIENISNNHSEKRLIDEETGIQNMIRDALAKRGSKIVIKSAGVRGATLSKENSVWITAQNEVVSYISEVDFVYASDRGPRNFARNCIVSASEYDFVVIDFVGEKSEKEVMSLLGKIRTDMQDRIISIGVSKREIKAK